MRWRVHWGKFAWHMAIPVVMLGLLIPAQGLSMWLGLSGWAATAVIVAFVLVYYMGMALWLSMVPEHALRSPAEQADQADGTEGVR